MSCDVAEEVHRRHNTEGLLLVSWHIGFIWKRGKQTDSVKTYDTKKNHYLCTTTDNIVLLFAGSRTTRAKRSFSRIWDSSPKLSVRRTWEHEGRKHTHEYFSVNIFHVCNMDWLTSLKGLQTTLEMESERLTLPEDTDDTRVSMVIALWGRL